VARELAEDEGDEEHPDDGNDRPRQRRVRAVLERTANLCGRDNRVNREEAAV
jgi:hypothetical protein